MTKVVIHLAAEKSVSNAALSDIYASINIENIKVKTVHKRNIKQICLHFTDFCIVSCLFLYYPLALLYHPLDKIVR